MLRKFLTLAIINLMIACGGISAAQGGAPTKSGEQSALQRGQAALGNGDIAKARSEFEKAVRLAPSDAAAQAALGWVLAQQGEGDAARVHR